MQSPSGPGNNALDVFLMAIDGLGASLQPGYFATGTRTQVDAIIDGINKRAGVIEQKITVNKNYYTIRYRFEKIMKAYYERTENCRKDITVTEEETQNLRNI